MAKSKEQIAADKERRLDERIVAIAHPMIPAKHLSIWAMVRLNEDDVSPSEVWRALVNASRYRYDPYASMFFHITDDNKEG